MKSRRKLSKNCPIHGKNREIAGPYNLWTPVKSNIPNVWNWNYWSLFSSEIEVWGGDHGPPAPPNTTTHLLSIKLLIALLSLSIRRLDYVVINI